MAGTISLLSAYAELETGEWISKASKTYTEELAYVEREDGLGLEGAIISPNGTARKPLAIVLIHGNTSRFYDLPYIQLGRELAQMGYTFITANTHGHDVVSVVWDSEGGSTPGGACWERFDEMPLDIAPWVDLACSNGAEGVILMGHSFGANKAIYYQAVKHDLRVRGIVCASGDVKWKADAERLAMAAQMEAEGREDEVLPALEVSWYRMSARTFLGRARVAQHVLTSQERTPHIAEVECPILAFYGTEEEWCGTQADLDNINHNAAAAKVSTHIIEGADHVYWGRSAEVAKLVDQWAEAIEVKA